MNQLLTVREFAAVLGVTKACIRRWILEWKITTVKVGKRLVRIPAEEHERIIQAGLRPALQSRARQ